MKRIFWLLFLLPSLCLATNPSVTTSASAFSASAVAPLTITFGATAAANSLIHVMVGCADAAYTITKPTGYSDGSTMSTSSNGITKTYYKVAAGTETNVVVSFSGTGGSCDGFSMGGIIHIIADTATSTPLDVQGTPQTGSGVTSVASGTTGSVTVNPSICLATFWHNYNGGSAPTSISYTNSYTAVQAANSATILFLTSAYKIVTDGSTQTTTESWTNSTFRVSGNIECYKGIATTDTGPIPGSRALKGVGR